MSTYLRRPSGLYGNPIPANLRIQVHPNDFELLQKYFHSNKTLEIISRTTGVFVNIFISYGKSSFESSEELGNHPNEWERLCAFALERQPFKLYLLDNDFKVLCRMVLPDAPPSHDDFVEINLHWVERKLIAKRMLKMLKGLATFRSPKR